jgi:dTDP-4-dehydrorhamnose reductase
MTAESKILVLGASGFVGQQILQDWADQAVGTHKNTQHKDTVYFDPLTMSIRQIIGVENCSHAVILYGEREPDVCWQQPEFTHRLNVESTKRVILDCLDLGIVPVFASSEMVFSGKNGMYEETDVPDPILLYGKYKVEVEQFLAEISDDYIVFRLSKVMGFTKNDRSIFANWLVQLDTNLTGFIQCAHDQYFSLIAVSDVSRLLQILIANRASGIFHFSNGIRYNRLVLLNMLLKEYEQKTQRKIIVEPVSINDFGLPEVRPFDLSMVSAKIGSVNSIGFTTPTTCIQQLIQ